MTDGAVLAYNPNGNFEVETYEVEYLHNEGESWPATVYQPQGTGPFPVLLDVHGGAWNRGDRTNNETMDRALAVSGMAVVAVEFRLAPQHPYPAQVAAVNYATRWLKAHARDFNADPDSLGILGSSSGGHTALLSAMRPGDSRYAALPLAGEEQPHAGVRYLIAAWPVVDPYARYFFARDRGSQRLEESTEAYFLTEDAMQEGNPHMILQRGEEIALPPVIIIQGTEDDNLPVPVTEQFALAYAGAGGEIKLEIFAGMPHGFANSPGPQSDRALELIKTFVARHIAGVATSA